MEGPAALVLVVCLLRLFLQRNDQQEQTEKSFDPGWWHSLGLEDDRLCQKFGKGKNPKKPVLEVQACDPGPRETEAGGLQSQPGLHKELLSQEV